MYFAIFFRCCCSVKNRTEAKRIALIDSIAARKARVEELKRKVQDQRAKRDEYAAIISQQLSGISRSLFSYFFFFGMLFETVLYIVT